MVCDRCKMVVRFELEKLGFHTLEVNLGKAEIIGELTFNEKKEIHHVLQLFGFALIEDKKCQLVESIKNCIVELVHYNKDEIIIKLSAYIISKIHYDYSYISGLFTEIENNTIEKYYIAQKIEMAKELLIYNELTISEIAYKLYYKNVSHLSKQFKKVTGFTPTHFKNLKSHHLRGIENL